MDELREVLETFRISCDGCPYEGIKCEEEWLNNPQRNKLCILEVDYIITAIKPLVWLRDEKREKLYKSDPDLMNRKVNFHELFEGDWHPVKEIE